MTQQRKKLIEVALPLEAINKAAARENYIYRGNPSAVHKWWAQRPLAACRAILFSSLVDDPSSDPAYWKSDGRVDDDAAGQKRAQLFNLIEELVHWENSNNETVINAARAEIARCVASRKLEAGELKKTDKLPGGETVWDLVVRGHGDLDAIRSGRWRLPRPEALNAFLAEHAPPVLDPFCGGGSIPLEAQRLGLRVYASDLNPVAVLITKALIEFPPNFAGRPPVNPAWHATSDSEKRLRQWRGAQGLAEDVRYYGKWMRDEAEKRIGHLYPKVKVTKEMAKDRPDLQPYVGQELTVIAWLWARTVVSPNPAMNGAEVPLVRTFWLSTKKGKAVWAEPVVSASGRSYTLALRLGEPSGAFNPRSGTVTRSGAKCLLSGQPIPFDYIRSEAKEGRMGTRLLATVVMAGGSRLYLPPTEDQARMATMDLPPSFPDTPIPELALGFRVQLYGMDRHWKLFTTRQLTALATFSELVRLAVERVTTDATKNELAKSEYAAVVATYLACALDKTAEYLCTIVPWFTKEDRPKGLFARQAIPMLWDFAELNPLGEIGGTLSRSVEIVADAVEPLALGTQGVVSQGDATKLQPESKCVVSTDPPYYDNIGYADLSDFFYAWLRHSLGRLFPELFATLLTPKDDELIATPFRHNGDRERAERFFEERLLSAFRRIRECLEPGYPTTVYYAFKQTENDELPDESREMSLSTDATSTGWETMLEALIGARFVVVGTWPVRTERAARSVGLGTNALASSIVLVCRERPDTAPITTRKDFLAALKRELPIALRDLQSGNIAPVDLAQAAIGPGMAVFSRYSKVLETDGSPMRVRTALSLINQALDEVLTEQEAEFDADTRWALAWFEQHSHEEGLYGDAETLSKAKNVSVRGLEEAGFLSARGGKVRLLRREELDGDWDPTTDSRMTIWEVTQHLIRRLDQAGESGAADLLRKLGGVGEVARDLAYRLYTTCERKKWAQEALAYNSLVVAWPEVSRLARQAAPTPQSQTELFER